MTWWHDDVGLPASVQKAEVHRLTSYRRILLVEENQIIAYWLTAMYI